MKTVKKNPKKPSVTTKEKWKYLVCCGNAILSLSVILSQFIIRGSLHRLALGDTVSAIGVGIAQVIPGICKGRRYNHQLQLVGNTTCQHNTLMTQKKSRMKSHIDTNILYLELFFPQQIQYF